MTGKLAVVDDSPLQTLSTLALTIRAMAAARGLDAESVLGTGPLSDALSSLDEATLADDSRSLLDRFSPDELRTLPLESLGAHVESLHADVPTRKSKRSKLGAFYTPAWLVEHVLDLTIEPLISERLAGLTGKAAHDALLSLRIADPACGSGHFLIGVVDRLAAQLLAHAPALTLSAARARATSQCIFGVDRDSVAAHVCRCVLWLNANGAIDRAALDRAIVCADSLACASPHTPPAARPDRFGWRSVFPTVFDRTPAGFDAIVGNPPFLNQLRRGTARDARAAEALREWSGGAVTRFADAASAFLLLSTHLVRDGGRVGLVQPLSTLVTGDAQPIRSALANRCALSALWWSPKPVFEADVRTCAIVLTRRDHAMPTHTINRTVGQPPEKTPALMLDRSSLAAQPTWASLIAPSTLPVVTIRSPRTLADIAIATADFRDQYYGLRNRIVEDDQLTPSQRESQRDWPPLITSGLIDLARHAWGERATRLLNHSWKAPRADAHALRRDFLLAQWLDARLVPKVLLATQSRVLEAMVDEAGYLLPSVPVITLTPKHDPHTPLITQLWRVAAAICSPASCAMAIRHYAGAALSLGAIKLSAKQTLTLPIPTNTAAWDASASELRSIASSAVNRPARGKALVRFADHLAEAYELPLAEREPLKAWWLARRP